MTQDLLNESVLVLNKYYLAIEVCTVKDAICLLYKGSAKVVDENYTLFNFEQWAAYSYLNENKKIHSPRFQLLPPVVIHLSNCSSQHSELRCVKYSRKNIFARDKNQCQYCGKQLTNKEVTIDHIVPKCLGGRDTFKNIVVCCKKCNAHKGGKTPEQAGMKLIAQPKEPKWRSFVDSPFSKNKNPEWEKFLLGR